MFSGGELEHIFTQAMLVYPRPLTATILEHSMILHARLTTTVLVYPTNLDTLEPCGVNEKGMWKKTAKNQTIFHILQ